MKVNNRYGTLLEATEKLKERGYTLDFDVSKDGLLEVLNEQQTFKAKDVILKEFHRFEGMSDPEDMAIIYALETTSGEKGTIVDGYGSSGSERISKFVDSIEQRQFD